MAIGLNGGHGDLGQSNEIDAILVLGEAVRARLSDGDDLAAIALRVGEVARARGADTVVGASADGDRLAGAAALASSGGLRLWREGDPTSGVLILDSVLVTGVQLARATMALRSKGVSMLSAAVVAASNDALARARAELGLAIDTLDGPRLDDTRSGASARLTER